MSNDEFDDAHSYVRVVSFHSGIEVAFGPYSSFREAEEEGYKTHAEPWPNIESWIVLPLMGPTAAVITTPL